MADYVFKSKIWAKQYDASYEPQGFAMGSAKFVGDQSDVLLTRVGADLHPYIGAMFKHHLTAELQITFKYSDIDEARRLLGIGQNSAAIAKALDILERLDK